MTNRRQLLQVVATGEAPPRALAERARRDLQRQEEARRRRLEKSRNRRRALRQHQALQDQQHQVVVDRVKARFGPACELGEHDHAFALIDPHHLLPGSGRRQEQESEENIIRACRKCHDAYDEDPKPFIPAVLRWCRRNGYPIPNHKVFREYIWRNR